MIGDRHCSLWIAAALCVAGGLGAGEAPEEQGASARVPVWGEEAAAWIAAPWRSKNLWAHSARDAQGIFIAPSVYRRPISHCNARHTDITP